MLCGRLYGVNNCVRVVNCVNNCMVLITVLQYYGVLTALWYL